MISLTIYQLKIYQRGHSTMGSVGKIMRLMPAKGKFVNKIFSTTDYNSCATTDPLPPFLIGLDYNKSILF